MSIYNSIRSTNIPSKSGSNISKKRLDPNPIAHPFQNKVKHCKTTFSQAYISGSIPCRIQSLAKKIYLQWDESAQSGFSGELLVISADGLTETLHPYVVMAPMIFEEMLIRLDGCIELLEPYMEQTIIHLRAALINKDTSKVGLHALRLLLTHSKELCKKFIKRLIPALAQVYRTKVISNEVIEVLHYYESICGTDFRKFIKLKIPTYV